MIVSKKINEAGVAWVRSHKTANTYTSKFLTGEQAKELVRQCKAYVQSLKNGN